MENKEVVRGILAGASSADTGAIKTALAKLKGIAPKVLKGAALVYDIYKIIDNLNSIADYSKEYKLISDPSERAEFVGRITASSWDIFDRILKRIPGLKDIPGVAYVRCALKIGSTLLEEGINTVTEYIDMLDRLTYEIDGGNPDYYDLEKQLIESGANKSDVNDFISALEELDQALSKSGVDTFSLSDGISNFKNQKSNFNDMYDNVREDIDKNSGGGEWTENATSETKNDVGEGAGEAEAKQPPRDPLIIDLGRKGIELTTVDNGVYFDLDKNGFAEKTAWIGREDGFLALDRDGNGTIDNGGELFGDQVVLNDGSISLSGFEALAELDENSNGVIDANDADFANLRVWIDANQNGKSEVKELKTLEELDITSISLDHKSKDETDAETGTIISDSSTVTFDNGFKSEISEHWFKVNTSDTEELNILDGVEVTSVDAFGNVMSLNNAILSDETNELGELVVKFKNSTDYVEQRILLKRILYHITDSTDIKPNSRNGNMDARDLHVIEQFIGRSFAGIDGGSNPNVNAAVVLENVYTTIENMYFNLLNKETEIEKYLNLIFENTDKDEDGNIISRTLDLALFDLALSNRIARGENVNSIISGVGSWLYQYDKAFGTSMFTEFRNKYSTISKKFESVIDKIVIENVLIGSESNDTLAGTIKDDILVGSEGMGLRIKFEPYSHNRWL